MSEVSTNLEVPTRARAVAAHPDDAEFGCGGTLAKWAAAGCHIAHLVCTDGSKGSWDPSEDTARLVALRQEEQRAASRGAIVLAEPGRGLNGAVEAGVDQLAAAGARQVIVAHADLPLATDLEWLSWFRAGVTLVPDRRRDGTNVICIPTRAGFRFAYGAGSFERHAAEARRLDLPLRVATEPLLAWDVDVPADLDYAVAPS